MLEVEKVGKAAQQLPQNLGPRQHLQQPQDNKAPEKLSTSYDSGYVAGMPQTVAANGKSLTERAYPKENEEEGFAN